MGQPALHLRVHVAALRAVTHHKHIEPAMNGRWLPLQIGGVELIIRRKSPGQRIPKFGHNSARLVTPATETSLQSPRRSSSRFNLLVQLVPVGHYQQRARGHALQPLGQHQHQDALALPCVCQIPRLRLLRMRSCARFKPYIVWTRHLLDAVVEANAVGIRSSRRAFSHISASGRPEGARCAARPLAPLPLHKEFLPAGHGPVTQPPAIAAGKENCTVGRIPC